MLGCSSSHINYRNNLSNFVMLYKMTIYYNVDQEPQKYDELCLTLSINDTVKIEHGIIQTPLY